LDFVGDGTVRPENSQPFFKSIDEDPFGELGEMKGLPICSKAFHAVLLHK
jgi:hypothetical protein